VEGTPFAALAGNVACGPAGSTLLARVGLSVQYVAGGGAAGSCPSYTSAHSAGLLDAAHPAVAQALSEVAAVVAVADAAAGGVAAAAAAGGAPVVYRVYTSGIAQAAEAGVPAATLDALRGALARAVALADAALAAASSAAGRASASVVLSTVGVPGAAAAAAGRRLLNSDDPCIDFGNCTSPSPSPGWAPPSVSTVTESAIESYHVVLWTSVLLALVLGATVATLLGMDAVKEPALYAQLADPRAGGGGGAGGAKSR
jgi:hypothetical protein